MAPQNSDSQSLLATRILKRKLEELTQNQSTGERLLTTLPSGLEQVLGRCSSGLVKGGNSTTVTTCPPLAPKVPVANIDLVTLLKHSQSFKENGRAPCGLLPIKLASSTKQGTKKPLKRLRPRPGYETPQLVEEMVVDSSRCRPDCTFPVLVAIAIESSSFGCLTTKGIYNFIQKEFEFYGKHCQTNWKNSVRHCLSENDAFTKLKVNDDKSSHKGCHWSIHPRRRLSMKQEIGKFLLKDGPDLRHYESLKPYYHGMMNKKKDSRSLIDIRPAISTITSCVDAFDVIVSNASLDNAMPAISLDSSCLLSCEASIAAAELDDVADYMEVLRDIELPEVFHGEGDFQERKEAFLSHGDEQSQCRNLIDWILRD